MINNKLILFKLQSELKNIKYMSVIGDYKKVNYIDSFGEKGKIYEVIKNKQKYLMYEFS